MPLLKIEQLCLSYGEHCLLDSADLLVRRGDRLALVGRNGAGKSTLLKLIAGELQADGGTIWRRGGLRSARLEQDIPLADATSVYAYVASGLAEQGELLARYHQLAGAAEDETAMLQLQHLQQQIDASDAWQLQQKVNAIISRLELPAEQQMSELSGGWRRRVALGKALVSEPDILLLDEPTNHLDIPTIEWLEKQLAAFNGALVFISHDRRFLESLSNAIVWLDRGKLAVFDISYTSFLEERDRLLEIETLHDKQFDKRLAEEERWIRQGIKARRTRNEGRVRALKSLREQRSQRIGQLGAASMSLEAAQRSGKLVYEVDDLCYSIDSRDIIKHFSTVIMRGDRVGIIGENGAGKSTFLNLLMGKLQAQSGSVKTGSKLEVAYFDQERAQLELDKSVLDNIAEGRESIEINGKKKHIIGYLGDFLFSPQQSRAPVKTLSGGERNRLVLAKLFSKPANVLVLDEPTNDLDVETLELLEELLSQFDGSILLVSHDRSFMDQVVSSIIFINGDGRVEEFVGGYSDWVRQGGHWRQDRPVIEAASLSDRQMFVSSNDSPADADKKASAVQAGKSKKLSYKFQRELEELPQKIEAAEQSLERLRAETMADGFYNQDHQQVAACLKNLSDLESELDVLYERWTELEDQ